MFLYNITLQRATGISHAIHGNFSGELPVVLVVLLVCSSQRFFYSVDLGRLSWTYRGINN